AGPGTGRWTVTSSAGTVAVRNPLGQRTTCVGAAGGGLPTRVVDAGGRITTFTHSAAVLPGLSRISFGYDRQTRRLNGLTSQTGGRLSLTYDGAGSQAIASVTPPNGQQTTLRVSGSKTAVLPAGGARWTIGYDGSGFVNALLPPVGGRVSWVWSSG